MLIMIFYVDIYHFLIIGANNYLPLDPGRFYFDDSLGFSLEMGSSSIYIRENT